MEPTKFHDETIDTLGAKESVAETVAKATPESKLRKLGFLQGQFRTPEDFKAFAREEIDEMFFGNPDKLTMGTLKSDDQS